MNINFIKAFNDNYIWTIEKDGKVLVVDPGDAGPVIDYLKGRNLDYIILTHKHMDHVGGVDELKIKYGPKVYGPNETSEYKDYKKAYEGLKKLKNLADDTVVYPAHEYSLANLKFAKSIISNEDLDREYERVRKLRDEDKITLPSTIGKEKKINPFFLAKDLDEFIEFRNKKDNF